MYKEKLGIIIATKDRHNDLRRFFVSLSSQGVKPDQIVVVDAGSKKCEDVLKDFPTLKTDYTHITPPSLTRQRNTGIKMLRDDITLAAFFDDDIEFIRDSLKEMMDFWENTGPDTGAAAFNNMSERHKKPGLHGKLFYIGHDTPGRILPSGFQSIPCSLDRTLRVDWLIGCSMVYRKDVFKEFIFDEWFDGYARYEDVDFSYRVGRKYKMFVVCGAKVLHHVQLEKEENSFLLGKMQIINRLYFVRKNRSLSVPLCYWALSGLTVNNLIKGYLGRDKRYAMRFKGNMNAFGDIITKRDKAFKRGESSWN